MKYIILQTVVLILFSFSLCTADTGKEAKNYCKDLASWQQWHELLDKHQQDDGLHALYATRRGLCTMVESGQIDLDRAVRIFEKMRESLIGQYQRQAETEPKKESLTM